MAKNIGRNAKRQEFLEAAENAEFYSVGKILTAVMEDGRTAAEKICADEVFRIGNALEVDGQSLPLAPKSQSISFANFDVWCCPFCSSAHGSGLGGYSWSRWPENMATSQFYYWIARRTLLTISKTCWKNHGDKLKVTAVPRPRWTDPPDIRREDAVTLSGIAVRYCRLPHPDVVKRLGSAVFPVARVKGGNATRGTCDTVKDRSGQDRKVMYDDNATPRWALLWSHGFEQMAQPTGWTFAHVWDESDDPDAYTHLANLVMMPECFGSLSDKQGPLVLHLRHHAESVYGWRPANTDPVESPSGYNDLTWRYLDPIQDPLDFIRNRMARSKEKRVRTLRDLLGWQ